MRILFVCTGNQCRSPMAGALMRRRLAERGCQAAIASAGFVAGGQPAPDEVLRTMAEVGIDLAWHRSRRVDGRLIDAADLVVAMTRQHVVDAVSVRPDSWRRVFTLRELVRRGEAAGPLGAGGGLAGWVALVSAGRTRAGILGLPLEEDIADPMGGRQRDFDRTRDQLDGLVTALTGLVCAPPGGRES